MTTIDEVAPDVFRICTYVPAASIQFSQFLVRDDEPLLFHAGQRALFPGVREAVASLLDPSRIRWIGFSHYEADECGALNDWLDVAPAAQAICSLTAARVSVDDLARRPARPLLQEDVLSTGRYRFRFRPTPHVPHCWEAGLLFEETERTLFCSDLFHQMGDVEACTESDVLGRARETLVSAQNGPSPYYMPYTPQTEPTLAGLAELQPRTLATMHGSVFRGDGASALRGLALVMREVLGPDE